MDYDTLTAEDRHGLDELLLWIGLDDTLHIIRCHFLRTIPFADRICFSNGIEAACFAENKLLTCLLW
jgi:hypothetical protein